MSGKDKLIKMLFASQKLSLLIYIIFASFVVVLIVHS